MERSSIRFLVAVALAVLPTGAAEPEETPGVPPQAGRPILVIDAPDVDLGDVVRGTDAVGTITFRNTGDAVLEILRAKPG